VPLRLLWYSRIQPIVHNGLAPIRSCTNVPNAVDQIDQ
jgi:hypothetical protein